MFEDKSQLFSSPVRHLRTYWVPVVIQALLRSGYFPKELPPTFTTKRFADFVAKKSASLPVAPAVGQKLLISRPAIHTLGRPGQIRRKLQLWNPFNFYDLASTVDAGWSEINTHLARSRISLSVPVPDALGHRALVTRLTGNDLPRERARVRSSARYVLRTDIARFYHTIYTHSVPWALHGKGWSKANRKGGLGNELDRALRNGQDGQTLGIPVGPDTSLVIAEIIACAIDQTVDGVGTDALRFIDDFEVGFATRSSAEAGLARIEEALAEFELALNGLKTDLAPLPQELTPQWRGELRSYEFEDNQTLSERDLLAYFNRVFVLQESYPTASVIAYGVGRLRGILVDASDWDVYQHLLFQCALAQPGSLPTVLGQISRHQHLGISPPLRNVLNDIILTHAPLGHGAEVVWSLWSAIWCGMELASKVDSAIAKIEDPVVALVALHAREKGLIDLPVACKAWEAHMTQAELYDRNWLLAYEGLRRGWLTSAEEAKLRGDANFGQLFAEDVAFYDDGPTSPVAYLWDATGYGDLIPEAGQAEPEGHDF